jgi:hypothetical protein
MDLTYTYSPFHPSATEYTFSSAYGRFSRTDHLLGHKTSLNKLKTEIIYYIVYYHHRSKLGMNKRNCRNYKIHGDQTTYF